MSDNDKSNETVSDLISNIARTVGEVVSDVIETIEESVETLLNPEENKKENIEKTEETVNEETRIGYLQALPQAEEPEEEALAEPEEADAKTEIEAAIAKARETGTEITEKDELVTETLPELPRTNTAKLYIQSPNRIFLYWSISGNPFETLQKALGARAGNYQLVTRLINLQTKAESFAPAEAGGNWWYNVHSNTRYRVDLGFYAPNRPFIRLLSSNAVNTPRAAPSLRADTESDWIVSTRQFIQVLNSSGYSHEAFGVAFGSNVEEGETGEDASTLAVVNRFAPVVDGQLNLAELRWLLVSLAAGASLNDLQSSLSPATLSWLQKVLAINPKAFEQENVRTVLEAIFGSEFVEIFADQNALSWMRLAPVAVGASAIHFPEILFPQLRFPELRPAAAQNPFSEQFGPEGDYPEELFLTSSAEFIK